MLNILLPIIQIILAFILIIQVIMAIINISNSKRHALRFDFVLSSRTTMVEMLEKYSRIFDSLSIKVNADIAEPAVFRQNLLYVNRDWVYEHYAYPSLLALMEIVKSRDHSDLGKLIWFQRILFVVEVTMVYLSLSYLVAAVFGLLIALLAFSLAIYIEVKIGNQVEQAIDIAIDLLDLSDYEVEQAFTLLSRQQNKAHTYPVDIVLGSLRFLKFW